MPRQKCAFGFSCATMMQVSYLETKDCPNTLVYGMVSEMTEEENVALEDLMNQSGDYLSLPPMQAMQQMRLAQQGRLQYQESLVIINTLSELATTLANIEKTITLLRECHSSRMIESSQRHQLKQVRVYLHSLLGAIDDTLILIKERQPCD